MEREQGPQMYARLFHEHVAARVRGFSEYLTDETSGVARRLQEAAWGLAERAYAEGLRDGFAQGVQAEASPARPRPIDVEKLAALLRTSDPEWSRSMAGKIATWYAEGAI